MRGRYFERAGADVLFAPGLPDLAAVRTVCSALTKPVNFMVAIRGRSFTVAELEAAGVRRISLATSLYRAAMSGLVGQILELELALVLRLPTEIAADSGWITKLAQKINGLANAGIKIAVIVGDERQEALIKELNRGIGVEENKIQCAYDVDRAKSKCQSLNIYYFQFLSLPQSFCISKQVLA